MIRLPSTASINKVVSAKRKVYCLQDIASHFSITLSFTRERAQRVVSAKPDFHFSKHPL